ncbi:DUF4167 domain-containing protein [Thalassorhabdomicrobium marinisediminis]|uniref:DUF4167 domain-containing protein n=1 Tax=Thalassorhabdomicrobium marinisediminis TaxID=2170577 RepID=A0A2T7G130_9RHOB|nr:DUF4167 domain-containing protein [Thalassorhabdomicrobium marinisediminis]PVA08122.1 DUF4167 domain-containing protein [Thalassorhabdomicrobium marinisediminis]
MKSSRSRSRNKNRNNNRPSGGNIVNRVFDSSGPEGKVRGTPQQIIEKYNQLHRDAVLSGDRVNAENFAQHAEHYTRMLAEAQKEIDAKREEQEKQNRDRQAERDRERAERLKAQEDAAAGGSDSQSEQGAQPDAEAQDTGGSDLVETPEDAPKKRRSRKPKARPDQSKDDKPKSEKPKGEKKADKPKGDKPKGDQDDAKPSRDDSAQGGADGSDTGNGSAPEAAE